MKVCLELSTVLYEDGKIVGEPYHKEIVEWPLSVLPRKGEFIWLNKKYFPNLPEWCYDVEEEFSIKSVHYEANSNTEMKFMPILFIN